MGTVGCAVLPPWPDPVQDGALIAVSGTAGRSVRSHGSCICRGGGRTGACARPVKARRGFARHARAPVLPAGQGAAPAGTEMTAVDSSGEPRTSPMTGIPLRRRPVRRNPQSPISGAFRKHAPRVLKGVAVLPLHSRGIDSSFPLPGSQVLYIIIVTTG